VLFFEINHRSLLSAPHHIFVLEEHMPKRHIERNLQKLQEELEEKQKELEGLPKKLEKLKQKAEELGREFQRLTVEDPTSREFFTTSAKLTENNETVSETEDLMAALPLEISELEEKIARCSGHLEERNRQPQLHPQPAN